jgi:hypothetical protein
MLLLWSGLAGLVGHGRRKFKKGRISREKMASPTPPRTVGNSGVVPPRIPLSVDLPHRNYLLRGLRRVQPVDGC